MSSSSPTCLLRDWSLVVPSCFCRGTALVLANRPYSWAANGGAASVRYLLASSSASAEWEFLGVYEGVMFRLRPKILNPLDN